MVFKQIAYLCVKQIRTLALIKKNNFNLILSTLYRGVTDIRNLLFDKKIIRSVSFPLPIISIGNLAVGGTGKTPHTEYFIRLLKDNYRIATLSRGYKRKTTGFFQANKHTTAADIGDEPFQIFTKFPDVRVFVDEKRVHGVQEILKTHPDMEVILLDDAYQHRHIHPGLSILLTDFALPFTRDHVMPYGRLREQANNARRADVILVTKCPKEIKQEDFQRITSEINPAPHQSVFFSGLAYDEIYPVFGGEKITADTLQNTDVLVVSGIENPAPMVKYIKSLVKSVEILTFADHHHFSAKELEEIQEKSKNKIIITTEKDAARSKSITYLTDKLKEKIYALPLQIKILNNQENTFHQKIYDYVGKNSRNR